MTRSDDILSRLRAMKPAFKNMNIRRLRVYGSVARGEARPDSDIDLLVDFYRPLGLFEFIGIQHDFEDRLGIKVDLATQNSLHPALKDKILAEARDV
jgi:uncharacterized protein